MIPSNKKKNDSKSIIIAIVFTVITFVAVGAFILNLNARTKKENEFNLTADTLIIEGIYGENYALSDLNGIEMLVTLPQLNRKLDGVGLGTVRKGLYDVEGYGECNVYLYREDKCIHIIANEGKDIFINFKDEASTDALYARLCEVISQAT